MIDFFTVLNQKLCGDLNFVNLLLEFTNYSIVHDNLPFLTMWLDLEILQACRSCFEYVLNKSMTHIKVDLH